MNDYRMVIRFNPVLNIAGMPQPKNCDFRTCRTHVVSDQIPATCTADGVTKSK
jgi:hypothetical protein